MPECPVCSSTALVSLPSNPAAMLTDVKPSSTALPLAAPQAFRHDGHTSQPALVSLLKLIHLISLPSRPLPDPLIRHTTQHPVLEGPSLPGTGLPSFGTPPELFWLQETGTLPKLALKQKEREMYWLTDQGWNCSNDPLQRGNTPLP